METIDRAQNADITTEERILGVEYDESGQPVGITVDEWMDRLGNKLIDHYGEDFRKMLNEARAERNMNPL
jgi:hypothetical protein